MASQATGEVVGAVLEAIGERPDLVVLTATRAHAGALEDIARTVAAVLHPLAMFGCAAESVVGTAHEIEETPAIALWAGPDRTAGPVPPARHPAGRRFVGLRRLARGDTAFDPTAVLLAADPFTFPADEFLTWLDRMRPGLPVVGGNASGGRGPGGNRWSSGTRW